MAIETYENRAVGIYGARVAVKIIKAVPGHPVGATRYPSEDMRQRWIRMGVCELVEESPASSSLDSLKRSRRRRGKASA